MYYEGREAALRNGNLVHLVAFAEKKGPYGVNNVERNTSKYRKFFSNTGTYCHEIHAEVDLINKLESVPERIFVARFRKDGRMTMARPCHHCQNYLKHKGVKRVVYTNWSGEWEEMRLWA